MKKLAIALATTALFATAVPASAQTIYYEDDVTYRGWSATPNRDQRAWWGGGRDARAEVFVYSDQSRKQEKRGFWGGG
jgi:hypothetical protein